MTRTSNELLRGSSASKIKIVVSANTTWNLVNFRASLIQSLVSLGYEVIALSPHDSYASCLNSLGCHYYALPMDNRGTSVFRDSLLLFRFILLIKRVRPDVFLGFTVKPNVYGSIAAQIFDIPVVNNIAGLGTAFEKSGWINRLVKFLYRISLARSSRVFFQNRNDRELFIAERLISERVADRLPGSGVNLDDFSPVPLPGGEIVRFLLIARLLKEKGIGEYVSAARLLRRRGVKAEFSVLGFVDARSAGAILPSEIDAWVEEGLINFLGRSRDVRKEIIEADCIVLPSYYREGTPRALLEAAAMARPIVTTDSVGCRDVVDDGVNGFLCRPQDPQDLADKIEQVISMSRVQRETMGLRGRKKMELEFDEKIIIGKYLEAVQAALSR